MSTRLLELLVMPTIPPSLDRLKLSYTYSLGLDKFPINTPRSPALPPVAQAFVRNVYRLKRMMLAPAFVGDLASRMQRFTDIAEFEITGAVARSRRSPDHQGSEIFARMRELLAKDTRQLTDSSSADDEEMDSLVMDAIETGGSYAVLLASAGGLMSSAFAALLQSYVTSMWTIFETLAGDLWEAALNSKPDRLAPLKGSQGRLKKGRPHFAAMISTPRSDTSDKTVRLEWLQTHKWNLTNKMGTVLKSKFDFSSLDGIREAYACAFESGTETAEIDKILLDDALDILSALRNVIVHGGGNSHREYLARRKFLPALPEAQEGQPIPLDGENVSKTIGEALFCAATLLAKVDDWLLSH